MASFQNRIRIWEDTKEQSKKFFSNPKYSTLHSYSDLPEPYLNRQHNTQVLTWKMNPIDATANVQDKLGSVFPLLLNIANPIFPGNNIELGGPGQEENLFRRSNYCLTLNSSTGFYPIPEESCVYSPEVVIFRGNETINSEDYKKTNDELYNLRSENPENTNFKVPDEKDDFYKLVPTPRTISVVAAIREIELVFRIAANYGHDTVILYANGTSNLETFRKWVEHYNGIFKYVVFAIENETNFQAFSEEFSKPLKPYIQPSVENETQTISTETKTQQESKPEKKKRTRTRIRYRIKTT